MLTKEEKIEYWRSQRPLRDGSLNSPYHTRFFVSEFMYSSKEFNSLEEISDWIGRNICRKWKDISIEKWENDKWIKTHDIASNEQVKREKYSGVSVLEDFIDEEPIAIAIRKA